MGVGGRQARVNRYVALALEHLFVGCVVTQRHINYICMHIYVVFANTCLSVCICIIYSAGKKTQVSVTIL